MFSRLLKTSIARQGLRQGLTNSRRSVNNMYAAETTTLNIAELQGRFKVWVGFLRTPPPNNLGYDCTMSFVSLVIGGVAVFVFNWTFFFHYALKNFMADCIRMNARPQHPINHCQTLEERARFVDAWVDWRDKTYYPAEDEDEEDEE